MKRDGQVRLRAVPMNIARARRVVAAWHRHLKRVQGGLWAVACAAEGSNDVVGVAIVARPPRMQDDGWSAEIVRVATNGTPNASSFLMGLCRRIAFIQGYRVIRTKTRPDEPGSSLLGAGFRDEGGLTEGRSHSRPSRPRDDQEPPTPKRRWIDRNEAV